MKKESASLDDGCVIVQATMLPHDQGQLITIVQSLLGDASATPELFSFVRNGPRIVVRMKSTSATFATVDTLASYVRFLPLQAWRITFGSYTWSDYRDRRFHRKPEPQEGRRLLP
jgi:hypothetical protein